MQSTSAHTPRLVTFVGLSLAAIAVILVVIVWIATGDGLAGVYGWNTGPDGVTVTSVVPGLPADRAGIRAGDRVDFASLSLLDALKTAQAEWRRDAATLDMMRRQLSAMESLLHLRGASVGNDG